MALGSTYPTCFLNVDDLQESLGGELIRTARSRGSPLATLTGTATFPVLTGSRFSALASLLSDGHRSVLDVGCRDRALRSWLPPGVEYVGLDLYPPADVIANVQEGLPFESDRFDAAVLADVLEHLDDPHGTLDEAMRVSRAAVIIALPNLYSLLYRGKYVLGRTFGKYELTVENSMDRHRWLFNFDQAARFVRGRAERAGWRVAREHGYSLPYNRYTARIAYALARQVASPNVWAWAYMARLERHPAGVHP